MNGSTERSFLRDRTEVTGIRNPQKMLETTSAIREPSLTSYTNLSDTARPQDCAPSPCPS